MKDLSLRNCALLAVAMAALAVCAQPAVRAQGNGSNQTSRARSGGQPSASASGVTVQPLRTVPSAGAAGGPAPVPGMANYGTANFGMQPGGGPIVPTPQFQQWPQPIMGGNPNMGGYGYGNGAYGGYQHPVYTAPIGGPPVNIQRAAPPTQFVIPDATPAPNPAVQEQGNGAGFGVRNVTITPPRVISNGDQGSFHHHHQGFLGGFYYGNYTDGFDGAGSYPSVYSLYPGVPEFIFEPVSSVVVVSPPSQSMYVGGYIPFGTDYNNYQVQGLYNYYDLATTQNPMIYHGSVVLPNPYQQQAPVEQPQQAPETPATPAQPEEPSEKPAAPQYQPGSYKEAFADVESAWLNGDIDSIRKHLRNNDLKIAVSLKGKYAYSISSGDWADITRDAFDHLQTVSFQFTLLRFQKNGDVTGYAKHVYTSASKDGDKENTMYAAYTMRHRNNIWYIVSVDTAPTPRIKEQADQPAAAPAGNGDQSDSD